MPSKLVKNYSFTQRDLIGASYTKLRWVQTNHWTAGQVSMKNVHPHSRNYKFIKERVEVPHFRPSSPTVPRYPTLPDANGLVLPFEIDWARLQNAADAKFWGKVRYGQVGLGMMAATWGQSYSMIARRTRQLANVMEKAYKRHLSDRRAINRILREKKRGKEPLADLVLEVQFGWRPFVEDLTGAFKNLGKQDFEPQFIHSNQKASYQATKTAVIGNYNQILQGSGNARVTQVATVVITNPNLYLLEQLGLLNPAVAAWDRIPWSFVVGMAVNVNQMLSTMSRSAGLGFKDMSVTSQYKATLYELRTSIPVAAETNLGSAFQTSEMEYKNRSAGTMIRPSLQVSVPKLEGFESAMTASALLLQRALRLNRLLAV